jgi:hypothetical protein
MPAVASQLVGLPMQHGSKGRCQRKRVTVAQLVGGLWNVRRLPRKNSRYLSAPEYNMHGSIYEDLTIPAYSSVAVSIYSTFIAGTGSKMV